MKIGIIGAGRMGFTLGKHLVLGGLSVSGYYSRSEQSAREAAEFTNTCCYKTLEEIVVECDTLILTVPDDQIQAVVSQLDELNNLIEGKRIIHTSGALSSQVFSGMRSRVYGYSVHPIYATNSKYESYKNFPSCYITIEGDAAYVGELTEVFEKLGHKVKVITAEEKVRYHASCVMASNLVIGLYKLATDNMQQCGFSESEAAEALKPLFENNAENLMNVGAQDALTGPVARGDVSTVSKHLSVLNGNSKDAYLALTKALIDLKYNEEEKRNLWDDF